MNTNALRRKSWMDMGAKRESSVNLDKTRSLPIDGQV